MKITVVGGGAVGLFITYHLARAGIAPRLITKRSVQADTIKNKGIRIRKGERLSEPMIVDAVAINDNDTYERQDIVLIAVKSHQVHDTIDIINQLNPKTIVFLQNGIKHIDLFSKFSADELICGVIEHGILREGDNLVAHTGIGQIRWARVHGQSERFNKLSHSVNAQDFKVVEQENWQEIIETKLIINACINPLTALLQVRNGDLVRNEHYKKIMRQLFIEVTSALKREDREELWQHVTTICEKTAENKSSMYVDLINCRETEIESILQPLIDRGKDTKTMRFLYEAIKGKSL